MDLKELNDKLGRLRQLAFSLHGELATLRDDAALPALVEGTPLATLLSQLDECQRRAQNIGNAMAGAQQAATKTMEAKLGQPEGFDTLVRTVGGPHGWTWRGWQNGRWVVQRVVSGQVVDELRDVSGAALVTLVRDRVNPLRSGR